MKKGLKRILATIIAAAFVVPSNFLNSFALHGNSDYVYNEEMSSSEELDEPYVWTITNTIGYGLRVAEEEKTIKFTNGDGAKTTHTYNVDIDDKEKKKLLNVTISPSVGGYRVAPMVLDANNLSKSNGVITASIEKFPKVNESFKLTISADQPSYEEDYSFDVVAALESKQEFYVDVIAEKFDHATASFSSDTQISSNKKYYEDSKITATIKPDPNYKLKSFEIWYTVDRVTETKTITGNDTFKDWAISWDELGETKIVGKIYGDLEIKTIVTEELPKEYTIRIEGDNGIDVTRPSSSSVTVKEGQSVAIRAVAKTGYLFGDCILQSGKSYGSWSPGQDYLIMGNERIPVRQDGDTISFTISDIYADMTLKITSIYDEDNLPIEIQEGTRIDIHTDVGDTVTRGSDAVFYISTTSDDYSVSKITLKIGKDQRTVSADAGEITINGKNYVIDDLGDGVYSLVVTNIKEPIKVSATSVKSSSNSVSRPKLTIESSSNLKITKNVNGSSINSGDNVTFYFTPNKNYQISEITLRIGGTSKTFSASETHVNIGNESYRLSRDYDGVVSLYLTNVTKNVAVSAKAYFSRDNVSATSSIRLNKNTYIPFMRGYPDGTFRPDSRMTKAEAVTMLYNICDISNVMNQPVFSDVPQGNWSSLYINTFANAGIIEKRTYFYPNNPVTRGEMVDMLYRLEGSPSVPTSSVYFSDISNTENTKAIRYAASQGWINGYSDGTFRQYNYMTRAEVAAVMCRVMDRRYGGSAYQRYSDVNESYWAYRYIQMVS